MNLSMILTINNRPPEVSEQVAESLTIGGNEPDELVVVLDRPTDEARRGATEAYCDLGFPVRFVEVPGEPGWLGPARAWNFGFQRITGDLIYMISSEVVQAAGNVARARAICDDGETVVFGACRNSVERNLVMGVEPGFLAGAACPRPLGFIACAPTMHVLEIGGFDEHFMHGFWYDDDDFYLRLWRTGVDFVFDDSIKGVHLDHERPDLSTEDGQRKIEVNRKYMLAKHGTLNVWNELLKREEWVDKRLVWTHI